MVVDDKGIKDSWKEYMEKLMNEENEWHHKISAGVKEGPADCIRIAEVRAALKEMKRHKPPGLSGLVAEIIQATGNIGTQWLLDLCNGIVKERCVPEDWKSSVVLPVYDKKLSYRRGTARCVVSIEILPIATQQCRNYLYDKS